MRVYVQKLLWKLFNNAHTHAVILTRVATPLLISLLVHSNKLWDIPARRATRKMLPKGVAVGVATNSCGLSDRQRPFLHSDDFISTKFTIEFLSVLIQAMFIGNASSPCMIGLNLSDVDCQANYGVWVFCVVFLIYYLGKCISHGAPQKNYYKWILRCFTYIQIVTCEVVLGYL